MNKKFCLCVRVVWYLLPMAVLIPLLNTFGVHLCLLFAIFIISFLWILKPWEPEPLDDTSREEKIEEEIVIISDK